MENNILVNIKAWITAALATVTAVQEGGVTLLIDGETEAS